MNAQALRLVLSLLLMPATIRPGLAERGPFAPPDTPPRYMPSRQYDLQHLRLDLAFDWETRSVDGTATNVLAPLLPALDALTFHAAGLEVRKVRVNGEERPFTLDPRTASLAVRLGRAYGPRDRLEVAVDYSARPRAGLYFVGPEGRSPSL